MKTCFLLIIIFFSQVAFSQQADCDTEFKGNYFIKGKGGKRTTVTNPGYYKALNFWRYQLADKVNVSQDSATALKQLLIFRKDAIYTDTGLWKPKIAFDIFRLSDSAFCLSEYNRIKSNSTCGSKSGGDIFIIGSYIFLNRSECVDCFHYSTENDCCRSALKIIFRSITAGPTASLQTILHRFPIKQAGNSEQL